VTDGCSGVFISVRRGRGIEGLGCGLGGWASLQKKNLFRSQNDVRVHFDAVFDWQKTPTVAGNLGTRILRFNREMKFAKTVQKFTIRPEGDSRAIPQIRRCMDGHASDTYVAHTRNRYATKINTGFDTDLMLLHSYTASKLYIKCNSRS